MPKGVPTAGFRKTKNYLVRLQGGVRSAPLPVLDEVPVETEDQVYQKLRDRFATMERLAQATATGQNRALIISGPAGLGKSYGVLKIVDSLMQAGHTATVIKGYVRPTGLYRTLYDHRHPGSLVVFDDADSIFNDDLSLNLLKTACDMTSERHLSWLSETRMEVSPGEAMPRTFEFHGSIIFITNYNFDKMIQTGSRLAPHFEAMISRSHYLDLAMHTTLDYLVRIKQVVYEQGMLRKEGYDSTQEHAIVSFVEERRESLRELSLRMVLKLAGLMRIDPQGWRQLATVSCMK